MSTKKRSFWLWPSIHDLASAKDANKQGLIASIWCAVWLFIITVGQILSEKTVSMPDLWELMYVTAFIVIAWGIYKKIRFAPIAGLAVYLYPRIPYWIEHGPKNILFGIIISLAFVTSIRGAFAYHKINNDHPTNNTDLKIYDKEL